MGGSGASAVRTAEDDDGFDRFEGGVRAGIVDGDGYADGINFHHFFTKFKGARVEQWIHERIRHTARPDAVRTERCMRVLMTGESDHPRAAWHCWLREDTPSSCNMQLGGRCAVARRASSSKAVTAPIHITL